MSMRVFQLDVKHKNVWMGVVMCVMRELCAECISRAWGLNTWGSSWAQEQSGKAFSVVHRCGMHIQYIRGYYPRAADVLISTLGSGSWGL